MSAKKENSKKTTARKAAASKPTSGGAWDTVFRPRTPGERRYWLVKSEPEVFSFDDLLRAPKQTTHWNGVRNYVARNFMRDGMRQGDRVFYYHSGAAPAIVGVAEVVRAGYPDDTAFDPASEGFDEKSDPASPTWFMVDLKAAERLPRAVTLAEMKKQPTLKQMALLRIGRLSVTPVTPEEWEVILRLSRS
ncbi:MAG TPA: EVE domain-containing protein [Gemmatimonadaceae bacterium]|nr:EVE domain-containing protein [Gemmatimonadaceae bacterium]